MEVYEEPSSLFGGEETSKATTPEPHLPSTVELAPIHDVVLVLSNGVHVQIHTMVLRLASPVFAAMFGPHFAEGQRLDETNPPLVPLPDDDPAAVTLLCRILHHKYHSSKYPELELFLRFAELADKYDCVSAVRATAALWTQSHIKNAQAGKRAPSNDLLAITYLLDQRKHFRTVTREIIYRQSDHCRSLPPPPTHHALPPALPLAMVKLRASKKLRLRDDATVVLKRAVLASWPSGGYVRDCKKSTCRARINDTFLLLDDAPPLEGASIASHLKCYSMKEELGMSGCFDRFWDVNTALKPCSLCYDAFKSVVWKLMDEKTDEVVWKLDGLCLDCLKGEGKAFEARDCKVHADDLQML